MSHDLGALLDRFDRSRVLVVGDAMLDVYLEGDGQGLSREAPVPVVALRRRRAVPGGAANTATNLAALGADVRLFASVGDDGEGRQLRDLLDGAEVATELLEDHAASTVVKCRVVADGQPLARVDHGGPIRDGAGSRPAARRLLAAMASVDAVVVSDYGYGTVTPAVREALARGMRRLGVPLIVDGRDLSPYRELTPTAVKPNYEEVVELLGARRLGPGPGRVEQMEACRDSLLERTGAGLVAVTLDCDGALLFERGEPSYRTYARPVLSARATGAGDTFTAALTLALACGGAPRAALELASAAAAAVLAEAGTASCTRAELRAAVAGEEKHLDLATLTTRVAGHRRSGRRIVFTNGCFDLLHRGHVGYLSRAKALGDVLVVGVNADSSVRRLKGPDRPVCPVADRLRVLAALSCIDHLVVFHDDTPSEALEALRPDVYVKGGDYSVETLPEAPLVQRLGGTIHLLPYEDESTTRIIERIRGGGAAAPGRQPRHESSWTTPSTS